MLCVIASERSERGNLVIRNGIFISDKIFA